MLIFSKIGPLKAKKFQKMKKYFQNENFQIAISWAWKGFQRPSKGFLIRTLIVFQILKRDKKKIEN